MNPSTFKIYNASAGSGKTYTLVKEYLKTLFKSPFNDAYKNALAITFTNKAVGEMKERIIERLVEFSDEKVLNKPPEMFLELCKDLSFEKDDLHKKSKKILQNIIHNYAAFEISTIDKFTQKLIRTFAYDLKLPINFEVELDTESLLNEAVDNLIAKAGTDDDLTKILVDFAFEKINEDKSWDVSYDFKKIAKLLTHENDIAFIEKLKEKTLDDFKNLKNQTVKDMTLLQQSIVEKAKEVLEFLSSNHLEFEDFNRKSYPNVFLKLSQKDFTISQTSQLFTDTDNYSFYTKKTREEAKQLIDELRPQLIAYFKDVKQLLYNLKFHKNLYSNITPLSVLQNIKTELDTIKEEQNLLMISEFNSIISNEIKNQPAPFIYERIGEKFKHYFIDEFQDTSVLQWQNLIPLLDNALASEGNSAMLVGDAKQAIYRWRGGKAEQFISLFENSPFTTNSHLENLPNNFRSLKEVVNFNNDFFKFLSSLVFRSETYANLYENSTQTQTKEGGYVNLNFLNIEKEDDANTEYSEAVYNTINQCLTNDYELSDICILVRYGKEGVTVAEYLSQNNIPIISNETLLLKNSPEVQFLVNLLKLSQDQNNQQTKIELLSYLINHQLSVADVHEFYSSFLNLNIEAFFSALEAYKYHFNFSEFLSLPVYEALEIAVHAFKLCETSNSYVSNFLEFTLEQSQKPASNMMSVLEAFQTKKDKLSITIPEGQNAVKIMTIHKAKGLEFPVVIFPFAELNIYYEKEPKIWYNLDSEKFNGFESTLLKFNKDLAEYSNQGQELYQNHQSELELDNINLLYVAFTRAIEQLHVISNSNINIKDTSYQDNKKYNVLLRKYLELKGLWNDSKTEYEFGTKTRNLKEKSANKLINSELQSFITVPKKEHNLNIVTNSGLLWDTKQQEAIEKGNLVHLVLSKIKTNKDVAFAFSDLISEGIIDQTQKNSLQELVNQVINHPQLKSYFEVNIEAYNEKDIISPDGRIYRPDRLNFLPKNNVVIIDYKTGKHQNKYINQLNEYTNILNQMNFSVLKRILVYINDEIEVKEV